MSWTPTFWIERHQYNKHINNVPEHDAHEFDIMGIRGVCVYAKSETSQAYADIHAFLQKEHVPHWLIDSEPAACNRCRAWGEKLT